MEVYNAFHILAEKLERSLNGHLIRNTDNVLLSVKVPFSPYERAKKYQLNKQLKFSTESTEVSHP